MEKSFVLVLMSLLMLLRGCDCIKECTNIPLSSHQIQAEMAETNNATWREEMISLFRLYDDKVNPFKFLTGEEPIPETQPLDWDALTRQIKNPVFIPPKGFIKEVPLTDVRLHADTIHGRAQETNLKYLLMLDPDRLIWSFRNTAGLPTPGTHYGGWESPSGKDIELRGHFVGHYLSGAALTWASTKNDDLKQKMSAVVAGLAACQEKIGTGYLSAFPTEFFDRLEEFEKYVWAPYYTIHKIMAGLMDQHTIAGNPQALKMVTWMADYFYKRVVNVITKYTIHRHYLIQNVETGGMNDILYKLYSITKDSKHLLLAHLFDKPCFLGLLAIKANDLAYFHANTHIPLVVGAQARYEVTGDPTYKEMGAFFMETMNSSHTYATGGTSVDEIWRIPARIADNIKTPETEESCSTYNMLKVSRNLFRWTKEVSYADYYERALTNGILSIQRGTEPGVMTYMLPLGLGFSKAKTWRRWGTPFDSFWCCYGTGIESFGKLGDSIYFEEEGKRPTLYIIQYISSSLNWTSGSVFLNQTVVPASSSDPYLRVTFTFSPVVAISSTLKLRVPSWTRVDGAKVTMNSKAIPLLAPGTFLTITRKWRAVDKVTIQFPMTIRTEAIKDTRPQYASIQAILYGPYLLAGHTTSDYGWDIKAAAATSDWITPIPADYNNQLVSFSQDIANATFALTNTNQSVTLQKLPGPGTDSAPLATFRLVLKQSSSNVSTPNDVIASAVGKPLMLEAFDIPGMYLIHQGPDKPLIVNVDSSQGGTSSTFLVVPGLDGRNGTISLESQSNRDCYVHSGLNSGAGVKLSCQSKPDANFNQATSFVVGKGISQYNPISFVAKGVKKNFLLEPLFNFRDEHYTTYFNIKH